MAPHWDERSTDADVVIADHHVDRAKSLRDLIDNHWQPQRGICELRSWDSLQSCIEDSRNRSHRWRTVIIPFDLVRPFEARHLIHHVSTICYSQLLEPEGQLLLLHHHPGVTLPLDRLKEHSRCHVWSPTPVNDYRQWTLPTVVTDQQPILPKVILPGDPILKNQLRVVDEANRGNVIEKGLGSIAAAYFPNCRQCKVSNLIQGLSGAGVFLLQTDDGKAVIKISSGEKAIQNSIRSVANYPRVRDSLNPTGQIGHVPQLLPVVGKSNEYLFRRGHLVVEAWQYLGGELGDFADFSQVYIAASGTTSSGAASSSPANPPVTSLNMLNKVLDVLGPTWYRQTSRNQTAVALWETAATLAQAGSLGLADHPQVMPPYRVVERRSDILSKVEDMQSWGLRLLPKTFPQDQLTVRDWLTDGPSSKAVAARPVSVALCPTHGDLNAHNILWWSNEGEPFFIDFATYHDRSHLFRDFAGLEAQIIFALMDRENDAPPALDLTADLLPKWIEGYVEKWLPPRLDCPTIALSHTGLQRALEHVRVLRESALRYYKLAFEIGKVAMDEQFTDEYSAALLYWSLRAIAFRSEMSPFKRLLAVQCAARLIRYLNRSA